MNNEWECLTVRQLKKALEGVDDDLPVHIFDYDNDESEVFSTDVDENRFKIG